MTDLIISPENLVERIKAYDHQADPEVLREAYEFAKKHHGEQMRASGDPYFSHPLQVAGILAEMRLDTASIITGLLHDTVEDTGVTLEDIKKKFGPSIAGLVDGVTKLTRLENQSDHSNQAESFRKLVLAMSRDIRVLLVKLADRLHNMRTLHYVKNIEKRKRISKETLEIYAPLAERIGIQKMKDELEDLAFEHLNPDARDSILRRIDYLNKEDKGLVVSISDQLTTLLSEEGLENFSVQGREKRPYSMWRKMQKKNITFEQLSDIMAFRVIVEKLEDCYQALGILHSQFQVVPNRFKDYISTPKGNGYSSIHTCIIGPEKQRIEVQIRTFEMHEIAELGVAAHWAYKQDHRIHKESKQYRWLREILDILEQAQKPEEFLEHTKLELFEDQVFCFSPRGDLISLPYGSTPVDFAYAVHSEIGDKCVGCKVNGKMAPLRTILQNGDQVEILTSKNGVPSPTWERFVITGKAKARIRKFIRSQQRTQYIALGKSMLQRLFKQEEYEFAEKAVLHVYKNFNAHGVDDIYAHIGEGTLSASDVFKAIFPGHKQKTQEPKTLKEAVQVYGSKSEKDKKSKQSSASLPLKGLIPGMAIHFAKCCHPLPGDRIVGIISTGVGVTIHTVDCDVLEKYVEMPERWIDVEWDPEALRQDVYVGRLSINLANEPGALGALSTIIGKNGGNISNLKIMNRMQDFFELFIDIEVKDVATLSNIMAALRASPIIYNVERMKG